MDPTGIQPGDAMAGVLKQRPRLFPVVRADEFTRRTSPSPQLARSPTPHEAGTSPEGQRIGGRRGRGMG